MEMDIHLKITDYIYRCYFITFLKVNFKWTLDDGKNKHAQLNV